MWKKKARPLFVCQNYYYHPRENYKLFFPFSWGLPFTMRAESAPFEASQHTKEPSSVPLLGDVNTYYWK